MWRRLGDDVPMSATKSKAEPQSKKRQKGGKKPDQLRAASLDWAITHLLRYGDSDLIPVAKEYAALKANWLKVRPFLAEVDLSQPMNDAVEQVLVPKPGRSFRVATRLEPVDTLLYTAAVYECAEAIEASRSSEDVACSYRIKLTQDGRFFDSEENRWDRFTDRSKELAEDPQTAYVLVADIADFYSQISHHRVCNALEGLATIPRGRAKNVEEMLGRWTASQSRGIPVGPYASIVLAEAVLDDVDRHLTNMGYRHVRFVDDFRIFCSNYAESVRALHDLTRYLYTTHRLTLQTQKTFTYKKPSFIKKVLEKPETIERREKLNQIWELWSSPYSVTMPEDDDDGDDEDGDADEGISRGKRAEINLLEELFSECITIASEPRGMLPLGLCRAVLRRASASRVRKILPAVLTNLRFLLPVFRDVVLYLQKVRGVECDRSIIDALFDFGEASNWASLQFVQEWVLEALTTPPFSSVVTASDLTRLRRMPRPRELETRGAARVAGLARDLQWIRLRKETWKNQGGWDRRATIFAAGGILRDDERKAWKGVVMRTGDITEQSVAALALEPVRPIEEECDDEVDDEEVASDPTPRP